MPGFGGPIIIADQAALDSWVTACSQHNLVAVDTEGDSLHCYREKLCLIQMSTPDGTLLIDPLVPLDFSGFNSMLKARTVMLHGCDYDLRMLRRGIRFVPGPVFDTYLGARLLGLKEVGLASLVSRYFEIELPKTSQKANWARRPLTPTMVSYAMNDTRYLLPLAERIGAQLRELGRWSWFEESCARAVAAAAEDRERDPEKAWKIAGSSALRGRALAVLRALWHWREGEAEQADRPSFQVLRNEELVEAAQGAVQGRVNVPHYLPSGRRKRFQATLRQALALPEHEWPQRDPVIRIRPTPEQEKRFEELRQRRDRVALELQLDPGVLAPRQALERLIREPQSIDLVLMQWQRDLLGL
ncbi:MAG: ribonuclease D [Verrucomicrobia bacterium]|nr:ribonuclease D [Verrucomicrobiota bacterium]